MIGSDTRRDVAAARIRVPFEPLSAADDLPALFLDLLDGAHHRLDGGLIDQRSHQRVRLQRVADPHLRVGALEPLEQLVADRAMRDDATSRRAALPGRPHGTEDDGGHDEVEVRLVGHDDRVVAAQLEDRAAEALAHHLRDAIAHLAAAGRRDERQARVVEQGVTDRRATADDHAEQGRIGARLGAGLLSDPGAGDRGERSLRGRLPKHRVAADVRDRGVPTPHRHREVERGDHTDDSERMPLLVHPVPRALRVHRQPVELTRQADREVADVDHLLDLALALGLDLPVLESYERAEILLLLAQQVAEHADRLAPLRGRRQPPLEEGRVSRLDHAVVLLRRDLLDAGNRLAVNRRGRHHDVAAADPLAAKTSEVLGFDSERGKDSVCSDGLHGLLHDWLL